MGDERETGTHLRRLRTETTPIHIHRRVRPLAQPDQTTPQPKHRNPRNPNPSLPQETPAEDRSHPNDSGCEIIMGNYNAQSDPHGSETVNAP